MFIFLLQTFIIPKLFGQAGVNIDNSVLPSAPGLSGSGGLGSVNMPTGTLNLSIPLCGASGYFGQVPVTLNYAATGIPVNQFAGNVGMGWSLSTGGFITRIVQDKPDDLANGYAGYDVSGSEFGWHCGNKGRAVEQILNPSAPLQVDSYDSIRNVLRGITGVDAEGESDLDGKWDTQPDIYYFNVMGLSGRFVLDAYGFPVLTPYQNLKITFQRNTSNTVGCDQNAFQSWVITDGSGMNYVFKAKEKLTNRTDIPAIGDSPAQTHEQTYTTTWYLSEIIAPNGKVEIYFDYNTTIQPSYSYSQITKNRYILLRGSASANIPTQVINITSTQTIPYTVSISAIRFPQGRIDFEYNHTRTDFTGGKAISKITVKNLQNDVLKEISFGYSNVTSSFMRGLRLDKLQVDQDNPYLFSYYSGNLPPQGSFEIDYWGFYNNNGSLTGIPPWSNPYDNTYYNGANRNPSLETTRRGTIQKIVYPTGGWVEYEYELNDYLDQNGQNQKWGGLRIRRIISGDNLNPDQNFEQIYTYNRAEDGQALQSSGTINNLLFPVQYVRGFHGSGTSPENFPTYAIFSSHPANYNLLTNGSNLIYKYVTLQEPGRGQVIHKFSHFEDALYKDILPEKYELRVHHTNDPYNAIVSLQPGVSPTTYSLADSHITIGNPVLSNDQPPYLPNTTRMWRRGLPLAVKVKSESGRTLSLTEHTYEFNPPTPYPRRSSTELDHSVARGLVIEGGGLAYIQGSTSDRSHRMVYGVYKELSEWFYMKQVTQKTYDDKDQNNQTFATQTTEYTYNPKNLQVKEVKNTNWEGRKLLTRYKYPVDFVSTNDLSYPFPYNNSTMGVISSPFTPTGGTADIYIEMLRRGMNSTVIEEQSIEEKPGNSFFLLSGSHTKYAIINQTQSFNKFYPKLEDNFSGGFNIFPLAVIKSTTGFIVPQDVLVIETDRPIPMTASEYTETTLSTNGSLNLDTRWWVSQELSTVYDHRVRIKEQRSRQNPITTTIYDETNNLTMAQVVNATSNQVGYESFESSPQASLWTYTPSPGLISPEPPLAHTGTKSFRGILVRNNLPAGTYKVSLWVRMANSNSISVNGASRNINSNQFTYQAWNVTLNATGNITINAPGVLIDEVRIHPVDASMVTYTHIPLVGVNSASDANSLSTHYTYDDQNRLNLVWDQDKNLISENTYHYSQRLNVKMDFDPCANNYPGETKSFSAQVVRDGIGTDPTFVWDFGDGTDKIIGQFPYHTYQNAGTYQVTLKVYKPGYPNQETSENITIFSPISATLQPFARNGGFANWSYEQIGCDNIPYVQTCDQLKIRVQPSGGKTPYQSIKWYTKHVPNTNWVYQSSVDGQTEIDFFCSILASYYVKCEITDACGRVFTTPDQFINFSSCN
ncbi:MAG: PKD domain-containing protein [Microscillaceae bacterium]|nr:PKD domain-containing protein [Microscillaceae bacterium]